MFARTTRLTLRPAWPEDAPAIATAIGHEAVVRMLLRVPFPYTADDAATFATAPSAPEEPRFLIVAHDEATPRIVGGIGIAEHHGRPNLGYWLTPDAWGRGYATEAGRAVVDMARHALPLRQLGAWHFTDNPASGRVLRKLGFAPTGRTLVQHSAGRPEPATCVEYGLDLADDDQAPMPIAA